MRHIEDRVGQAFIWMLASTIGFSIMTVFVKSLGQVVPQFQLVFFRSFVNCIVVALFMLYRGETFLPQNRLLLLFRGVVGFAGASCFFYAIIHLPISVASLINWISPLFVILFSWLFLGEKFPTRLWGWMGLAFLGLVLLLRPDIGSSKNAMPVLPVMVGLLGTAFAGLAYVAVRAATAKVGVNAIIFYFTATASALSAPLAALNFHSPSVAEWVKLILIGLFASLGQFAMTQAYSYAAAGLVSSMSLMSALFAALWGWLFFSETFVWIQWMGMALVLAGVSMVALQGQFPLAKWRSRWVKVRS